MKRNSLVLLAASIPIVACCWILLLPFTVSGRPVVYNTGIMIQRSSLDSEARRHGPFSLTRQADGVTVEAGVWFHGHRIGTHSFNGPNGPDSSWHSPFVAVYRYATGQPAPALPALRRDADLICSAVVRIAER